jgi:oligopeptide/dipeptide ABC transporter ATP-binding protein
VIADLRADDSVVIEARGISVEFDVGDGFLRKKKLRAVDNVDLEIKAGETLGLVGESGSGKSTTGRALLGVERLAAGTVQIRGTPISGLRGSQLRQLRRHAQMVFQDPLGSVNPRHRVGAIVGEPLTIHAGSKGDELHTQVSDLLHKVGLDPRYADRYPHTMSGGQLQRVAIARALAINPDVVICDEPVSALDVSIQAQIISLLRAVQRELGVAYLLIAHDLAVVGNAAHRIVVMYLGRVVELGPARAVLTQPRHPYTKALRSAVPIPDVDVERSRDRIILRGDIPNPVSPPSGCVFHTRCPWVQDRCREEVPHLRPLADGQSAACHFAEEIHAGELERHMGIHPV